MKRFGRFLELLNRTAGTGAVADQLSASEWAELRDEAEVAVAALSRDPIEDMPATDDPRARSEATSEEQAMFLLDCARAGLHALQTNADETKARNYVEFGFTGMSMPFDRATLTLIRPGGKTPHECVAEALAENARLKVRLAALEKIASSTSCHPGSASIIAESHRCVLKAHGVQIGEELIDELARNAAHVLKLTADADKAEAESAAE